MDVVGNFLNFSRLNNAELFEQFSLLGYVNGSKFGKESLQFVTLAKILNELYCRFTEKERIIEALRLDAIQKVAAYTRKHPRASTQEQAKEIQRHIDDFTVKVTLVNAGVIG